MKVVRVWVEEAVLQLVEEVWLAGENDQDSHKKVDESGEPVLASPEWGYKETARFSLELGEDATDKTYWGKA